jgi:hypothetical protein
MSNWVLSSNPTTYNLKNAFLDNPEVDWVTKQRFEVGDIVYIYEVIPPRGRGGIFYKAEVVETDISMKDKFDDRNYWANQIYPKNFAELTRFIRIRLLEESNSINLSLKVLCDYGFSAPQGSAHLLDNKHSLLKHIQSQFSS